MGKRRKWVSKGWWKYQARRPKVAATKASAFLWAKGKALWLRLFPTKLSDDELFANLAKDVKEIQKHITDAFRSRKMFRDTTEMLQKHPRLSTSPYAGYWYEWFRTLYAHYIVMAVRRELDRDAASALAASRLPRRSRRRLPWSCPPRSMTSHQASISSEAVQRFYAKR